MLRLFAALRPRLVLISLITLLTFASTTQANLITWNLSGVTLDDGSTVTGSFTYETANSSFPSFAINVSPAAASLAALSPPAQMNPFTLTPANTYIAALTTGWNIPPLVSRIEFGATSFLPDDSWFGYDFMLFIPASAALSTPGVIPLVPEQRGLLFAVTSSYAQGKRLYVTAGELSAVPLPPTVLLLGSGLLGLAGWRRFRKG